MKSRDEVERLKSDWLRDPCYDLVSPHGCPDGFEEYEAELAAFQSEHMERWKKEQAERVERVQAFGSVNAYPAPVSASMFSMGFTKREAFALSIAAGLAARADWPFEDIAASAVKIADDLLDRLSKE